jgi:hypothetical protein
MLEYYLPQDLSSNAHMWRGEGVWPTANVFSHHSTFKAFKQYCDTKVTPNAKNPKTRIRKHRGGNQGTLRFVWWNTPI